MRAKYVLSEVMVGLWRNVTMTVAMIITMAVSLTMLGGGLLLFKPPRRRNVLPSGIDHRAEDRRAHAPLDGHHPAATVVTSDRDDPPGHPGMKLCCHADIIRS